MPHPRPAERRDLLLQEGRALQSDVAPWFGVLFRSIGTLSLFGSAMGFIDYTSRLAADVL